MSTTIPLLAILQHTPLWVWALLALLLAVGYRQSLPRRVGLRRAALLPAVLLAWSLWSVASGFGSAGALAAWALGAAVAAAAAVAMGAPAGARWSADLRCFEAPGSWVPLLLIVALFCVKFGVGASLAMHPALRDDEAFAAAAGLAYGGFSGLFAGRALALLRLVAHGAVALAQNRRP
jgi:hypothetical protein